MFDTCCFTDHRLIKKSEIPKIQELLIDKIKNLLNKGVIKFLNGGALGFDMIAADTILAFKSICPQIQLIMVLPCKNQSEKWSQENKLHYQDILNKADKIIYLSDKYYDECMLDRNRYLVDNSNYCIAFLKHKRGGTLFTVNYAKKLGKNVINIAELL